MNNIYIKSFFLLIVIYIGITVIVYFYQRKLLYYPLSPPTFTKDIKKNIDDTIARINKRIIEARKKAPNAFPGVKASLGHGRAASRYEHSGDIVSNIDLENFFINVQRSNLDEVSDPFNRALGRSLDLDEEILKFIDKDIGKFHKGFTPTGGPLTRKQKEKKDCYVYLIN